MNSVKIKICGITNADDALACAGAGADYLGFIFAPMSPRYITPEKAGAIIAGLPEGVVPVGVFVDPDPGAVAEAVAASGVRLAQLCGNESPDLCRRISLPVIKVFRPPVGSEPSPAPEEYDIFAAMVDGGGPGVYGGSGIAPDLEYARTLSLTIKLFLAGGLHHGNVAEMAQRIRPYAVDVNSGTEARPGVKDRNRVALFCANLRSAHLT